MERTTPELRTLWHSPGSAVTSRDVSRRLASVTAEDRLVEPGFSRIEWRFWNDRRQTRRPALARGSGDAPRRVANHRRRRPGLGIVVRRLAARPLRAASFYSGRSRFAAISYTHSFSSIVITPRPARRSGGKTRMREASSSGWPPENRSRPSLRACRARPTAQPRLDPLSSRAHVSRAGG